MSSRKATRYDLIHPFFINILISPTPSSTSSSLFINRGALASHSPTCLPDHYNSKPKQSPKENEMSVFKANEVAGLCEG